MCDTVELIRRRLMSASLTLGSVLQGHDTCSRYKSPKSISDLRAVVRRIFYRECSDSGLVRYFISGGQLSVTYAAEDGQYSVSISDLTGGTNAMFSLPFGLVFAVWKNTSDHEGELEASGYILYNGRLSVVWASGDGRPGVYMYHPPSRLFNRTAELRFGQNKDQVVSMCPGTEEVWNLSSGHELPSRRVWSGCLITDFHTVLLSGGFLQRGSWYPDTERLYEVCESKPLGFIMSAAGGAYRDGASHTSVRLAAYDMCTAAFGDELLVNKSGSFM